MEAEAGNSSQLVISTDCGAVAAASAISSRSSNSIVFTENTVEAKGGQFPLWPIGGTEGQ